MTNEFLMTVGPNPSSGSSKSGASVGISCVARPHGHCFFSNCSHFFSNHLIPALILAGVAGATIRCIRLARRGGGQVDKNNNAAS
ncbi:unnamed protein product [Bursaphelenchus xylophilus]|uniref:(pine wood nematode) hypothetical protein n=1 Tax=Bursaphelenchus xylophilus TaxID=6326 RepID=A0A1I7RTM1_BURXY|nr:unnamed protein product [Bursaphelenchus xylophilus]CAG9122326.1 unnamed protein product [Bursaphelenchus xylophilus]